MRKEAIKCLCPVCGVEFETLTNSKTYCSVKCRKTNSREKLEEYKKNIISTCAWCGKKFKGNRKYCNSKCRLEANKRIINGFKGRLKKPKLSINDVLELCKKLNMTYGEYSKNEQLCTMRGESYEEQILRKVQGLHQGG